MPLSIPLRPLALAVACVLAVLPVGATAAPPNGGSTLIGRVQGTGATSPMVGQLVTVEGRISADFGTVGGRRGLGGWFVQDSGDADPTSSDGLFVTGALAPGLTIGSAVRVHGRVVERDAGRGASLTAIEPLRVEAIDAPHLAPLAAQAVSAPAGDWERHEGMLLRIAAPLTVIDHHAAPAHGQVQVAFDGRLWQPNERERPGSAAARELAVANSARRLMLDDGFAGARRPRSGDDHGDDGIGADSIGAARLGSTLHRVEGVLDQRDGRYRLQLTRTPQLQPAARPAAPRVDGDVRIAALNLENLFNGDGLGGGFPTERGARSVDELRRQLARQVATLRALDADVVALMELENDGYDAHSSLAQLVQALNARPTGAGAGDGARWQFVRGCADDCRDGARGPGVDTIRVGLIFRTDRVRPQGTPATLEGGPFGDRSRVPLAQAFVPVRADGRDDGAAFVVVANHFKSKSCSEALGDDRDQGDGAGCWNALRTDAARRLDAWLKTDPTRTGSDLTLIVGDLNAYAQESPVRALADAGWRDAFVAHGVPAPYSYAYKGELGRLDHALLSPAFAQRLRGAAEWHANADEPESAGYRDNPAPGPWRSSDHDPLLLGFALRASR
ncbi:ExeM/NucH family extracellular endonuclease [Montanilutibacter psychrotolerans]|uniref:ExeM/NucH family extracellular endonuclease n=1 Tax=Montanilutibacter psychrotolerans TaxID=1327343 RepID=A0A3M8SQW8_9GAMM|nr:ExeM/NucH family extracellular endonuclease [Lysobacter psychrotolerans]RNF83728.1 ExeM/NucH family extracellular endonuclease [Lysobacter psychrotolerans]